MSKHFLLFISAFLLICPASYPESPAFKQVDGTFPLEFPRDHGSHPDYNTEWWYFVGHLKSEQGRTFGFELTFFRIGIDPEATSASHWRDHSLYLTHVALTDDQNNAFFHDERTNRGAFDQAGASTDGLEVWNQDWTAALKENTLSLSAKSSAFSFELRLNPVKPVVLHGDKGFSRKGPLPGQASYYSSFTRLMGNGEVRVNGEVIPVNEAQTWMDHEVTSESLPENITGWDWFAIQLENNEEFMLYQLRTLDRKKDAFSKGSYIHQDGSISMLKHDDYVIEATGEWKSPKSGITYPSGWKVQVLSTGHVFEITPTVTAQELLTEKSTGVNYWEGRCLVNATYNGKALKGNAYVELTGYDKALRYRN